MTKWSRVACRLIRVAALSAVVPLSASSTFPVRFSDNRFNEQFSPLVHGFAFRNAFEGSPLPPALRNADSKWKVTVKNSLESNANLPNRFGLCGGMSAAAMDYFHANRLPPDDATPPKDGSSLYDYLYQRNADSMGSMGVMAVKFLDWMRLPDSGPDSALSRSIPEIRTLVARLNRGELVPVGLVLVKAGGKDAAWDNHQVLAYWAVERDGALLIRIYDPNSPRDEEAVLRINGLDLRASVESSLPNTDNSIKPAIAPPDIYIERFFARGSIGKVRGLFIMPYSRRTPPKL